MDFELTAGQRAVQAAARELADELGPGAALREAEHRIEPGLIERLASRGMLGVNIPKALGGQEAGVVAYACAVREIARADAAVAVTMAVTNMVAEVLVKFGTPEQQRAHVPKLTSGEYFGGAFGLSEPGAGSDAAALGTRARRDGDDWLISGQKLWITTGDQAGVIVVWARSSDEPGARAISCFLVERGAAGLSAGKPEEKMGLTASHTVALSLDEVRVPAQAQLGDLGQGFRVAMTALDGGRIGIGAQATGIATGALEKARALVGQDVDQGVQWRFADMATEVDAAWLLVLRAAQQKELGRPFSQEAAMAKLFASEAANRVVRAAIDAAGPAALVEIHGLARLVRDCRVTQIYEGTSEVQRLVIGRGITR